VTRHETCETLEWFVPARRSAPKLEKPERGVRINEESIMFYARDKEIRGRDNPDMDEDMEKDSDTATMTHGSSGSGGKKGGGAAKTKSQASRTGNRRSGSNTQSRKRK
jgi:hypothetical protein